MFELNKYDKKIKPKEYKLKYIRDMINKDIFPKSKNKRQEMFGHDFRLIAF